MKTGGSNPVLLAVEAHYQELMAFVRRRVGCPALAADILQETWLKVAALDPAQAAVENPRAYLYRVAGSLAVDRLRQDRVRMRYVSHEPAPSDVPSLEPPADEVVQGREEIALLEAALRELPETCRSAFLLYKGHGLSMKEVGARLGLSPRTVEKHIARAIGHCRRRLREAGRSV